MGSSFHVLSRGWESRALPFWYALAPLEQGKAAASAFFTGLKRVHFPDLHGHQLVHRTQALGNFLLFGGGWDCGTNLLDVGL